MQKHNHIRLAPMLFLLGALFTLQSAANSLPDFTALSEANSPTVVNISTRQKPSTPKRHTPKGFEIPNLPENSPFHEFFRHFFDDNLPDIPEGRGHSQSLGSGFIISSDGYILTNHHVVDEADEIEVRLNDRRYYEAEVIGSDKASDVALIKIDADDLPVVKTGSSTNLKVGEWVLAIGSPFGFDYSVTAGIVSAKGRSLPSENYVPFIQTDVAINPGNSGGPLFNMNGEVIGINSQIYSRTGGFMGLSFAIPIELAINVADQLRDKGSVSRGYLGVLIQNVDRNLAESFGLAQPTGALVSQVMDDSPAEEAGLQPGDIILSFNQQKINNSSELPPLVGISRIHAEARLEILRHGEKREMKIRIGELPNENGTAPAMKKPAVEHVNKLGFNVTDLDAETREQSKLQTGGALITQVKPGAGRRAGLRSGDVIQMYDGQPVASAQDLEDKVAASDGKKSVAVLILRQGEPMFIALRLTEKS